MDDKIKWLLENGWKAYPLPPEGIRSLSEPKLEPKDDLGRSIIARIERIKANNWDFMNLPPLPGDPHSASNPFRLPPER